MTAEWLSIEADPGSLPTSCDIDRTDGCITCGDVAVVLRVVEVRGSDAHCCDDQDRGELVATELVGRVSPGDLLLVHAGVALERLPAVAPAQTNAAPPRSDA